MDNPARRGLAAALRDTADEELSMPWYVALLAADEIDPDARPVDQWTPLWIRASVLDEPTVSEARAILKAIDDDDLRHTVGEGLRSAYYTIVEDHDVPTLAEILTWRSKQEGASDAG